MGATMNDERLLREALKKLFQDEMRQRARFDLEFFEIEAALLYAKGMDKRDSIIKVQKRRPQLHQEFLLRMAGGGKNYLSAAFNIAKDFHDEALTAA